MHNTTGTNGRADNNVWKGLAAGLIGGLVASWTMNRFQDVWTRLGKRIESRSENQVYNVSGEHLERVEKTSRNQEFEFASKQRFPTTRP